MTNLGKSKKAGVIGWPISHSRSPALHGHWLKTYGIDGEYLPLAVEPENLASFIKNLADQGFAGANVTVPHKEAAMAACDSVEPLATRIGAVNTLVVGDAGKIEGRNTDAFGFIENLRAGAPEFEAAMGPAVVIGAGGAARAIVAALIDAGAPAIRIVNRTHSRAEEIVEDLGSPVQAVPIDDLDKALRDAALLVNSTTLGMTGQPPLDIDLEHLPETAVVNDIVYNPIQTQLLKIAAGRGNPVVDGVGMLLHQARPGFHAWFGVDPEVTAELRAAVLGTGET